MLNPPKSKLIKAFGFLVSGEFFVRCNFKPPRYLLSLEYDEYFIGLEFGKYHANALVPITDEDRDYETQEREYKTFIENLIQEIKISDFESVDEYEYWIQEFRKLSEKASLVIFTNEHFYSS